MAEISERNGREKMGGHEKRKTVYIAWGRRKGVCGVATPCVSRVDGIFGRLLGVYTRHDSSTPL